MEIDFPYFVKNFYRSGWILFPDNVHLRFRQFLNDLSTKFYYRGHFSFNLKRIFPYNCIEETTQFKGTRC